MINAIFSAVPLILVFLLGYVSKKAGVLSSDDGSTLLKLAFYIGVPALIFQAVLTADLSSSSVVLALLPLFVMFVTLVTLTLLKKNVLSSIPMKTYGTLLVGVLIMNNGFLIPFVERAYGADGIARLAVIDTLNAILAFTLVYGIAVRYGSDRLDKGFILRRVVSAPALWAFIGGLLLRFSGLEPPVVVIDAVELVSRMVAPTILIALGLKFTAQIERPRLLVSALALRFVLGFAIGYVFVTVFGLSGLDAQVALLVSAAPIGFNSITFADLEKLDVDFAASQVSVAIVVGMILVPVMIYLLPFIT
jgi:malate permease and related proteins